MSLEKKPDNMVLGITTSWNEQRDHSKQPIVPKGQTYHPATVRAVSPTIDKHYSLS